MSRQLPAVPLSLFGDPELARMALGIGIAAGAAGLDPDDVLRVRERLFDRWGSDLLSHIRYVNLFLALVGAGLLTPAGLLAILDEADFDLMDSAFQEGCRRLGWRGDEAPGETVRKAWEAIHS